MFNRCQVRSALVKTNPVRSGSVLQVLFPLKTCVLIWLILAGYLIICIDTATITNLKRYGNVIIH